MKTELPKIETRKRSEINKLLKEFIPHYTPEWAVSDENDPGVALLEIFSYMTESIVHRLNQAPQKNFIAFLDMLGINRLPSQPSRAPLTFMLAKGLEKDVLIPERTQVAGKASDNSELPFETEKNLLAIASQLKKVVAYDPAKDAIYIPPQDFLNPERKLESTGVYKTLTSTLADTRYIQIDSADGLKEKDLLRIGSVNGFEYKEIKKINTTVIEVTDDFKSDFPIGTIVEKVTNFTLFEGKDMQEHCVYIAHKDFFNVKSTLTFTIYITQHLGTEAGVTSLDVSWEYWGEVKTDDGGGKGEDWHKFVVFSDDTNGLSESGVIRLSKTTQGEIKEREINGEKNRWIRCRLNKNMTDDIAWKLPELDNIQFQVSSGGAFLDPDLAFYNDTPLDISQSFKPFGEDPVSPYSFAIASKEVFSKKGAKIEIDVTVEQRGILSAPTAISFDETVVGTGTSPSTVEKIRVFAAGTGGRLIEVKINPDGTDEAWDDHGFPKDTQIDIDSIPSAVTNSNTFISVFARAKNSHLVELFYNSAQWTWKDQGTPLEGVDVIFDPSAVYYEISGSSALKSISVFVTGSNGKLYEFNRRLENMAGTWVDHGKPQDTSTSQEPVDIASSPDAKKYEITQSAQSEIRVKIFVNGVDGQLYELDCKPGDDSKEWLNHGRPGPSNSLIKLESRPFALVYGDDDSKIFVKGNDGNLWIYDKETGSWDPPLGKPSEVAHDIVSVQSDPHGPLIAPEKINIFIRGSDNHLWNLTNKETTTTGTPTTGTTTKWTDHKFPSNSELLFSPFVIKDKIGREHVFSASNQHSIIERRIDTDNKMIWNEYEDPNETSIVPALSWQYGTKKDWGLLKLKVDETKNLLKSGKIIFYMPDEIEEKEIGGQKSFWIRAKIESGDYGRATFTLASETIKELNFPGAAERKVTEQTLRASKTSIRSPIINNLKIGYAVGANQYPEKCLTYNNLMYLDQTETSKITDKFFRPFVQMDEKYLTIYLGFEKYFRGGPVRIFFAANELKINDETKPKLEWFYSIDNGWNELKGYNDYTEGLIKTDILEVIGPLDFAVCPMFSESLSWIKGSLLKGTYDEKPLLRGIYPNTTWALQAESIKNEIIGSSDGNPDQVFSIHKTPVLENQNIRVLELLSEEEKQDIIKDLGKAEIEEIKDEKGKIIETWVSWTQVPDFFDSDMKCRHYTLDRATGLVQFGDGTKGMIPPNGDDNIKAFYQTGGGEKGNIGIGEIKSLKTSVPGVEKVSNPVASDGGANAATIEQMLEIGPAKISHRTRAVTILDFEWLARKASRKVIKARCMPNTGKISRNESGKVAVIIVPDEKVAQPAPSLELIRKVQAYLEQHCANTISSNIYVASPSYMEVNVSVDVFVNSIDLASQVEREVKKKLDDFFHPLTGYLEGKGWDFGRNVSESDIYTLIENIDGVDHVENLNITSMIKSDEEVPWKSEIFLVANGNHKINTIFEKESNLYGSA